MRYWIGVASRQQVLTAVKGGLAQCHGYNDEKMAQWLEEAERQREQGR